jgi:hypothetical protein
VAVVVLPPGSVRPLGGLVRAVPTVSVAAFRFTELQVGQPNDQTKGEEYHPRKHSEFECAVSISWPFYICKRNTHNLSPLCFRLRLDSARHTLTVFRVEIKPQDRDWEGGTT